MFKGTIETKTGFVRTNARAGRDRSPLEARVVSDWVDRAEDALVARGDLLHAHWSATSDIAPDDLRRMGLTEERVAEHVPLRTFVSRPRAAEAVERTRDDVEALADQLLTLVHEFGGAVTMARVLASSI